MSRTTPRSTTVVATIVTLLAIVGWLGPYVWMVLTSLRTLPEIVARPTGLPTQPTLAAYREVWTTLPLGSLFAITTTMALLIALDSRSRPRSKASSPDRR